MNQSRQQSPWLWVPTLYFAEGIPYFLVNSISIALFSQMGMPNGQMALFTSLISFPWLVKPIWSPFVDVLRTKRWWILMMQALMAVTVLLLAWLAPYGYTTLALIFFTITAFLSATHDIAADGYYMLALDEKRQNGFVGVRSTFYKIASIFSQAVLLKIVDVLQQRTDVPTGWMYMLLGLSALLMLTTLWHYWSLPKVEQSVAENPSAGDIMHGVGETFVTFFKKPGIVLALCFMLIYRLPEALLLKLNIPFFMAPMEEGGLALSLSTIANLNAINLVMTIVGGLLGGVIAAKWGLKKTILFFAFALTLPCFVYVYMAMAQTTNFWIIAACIGFEQLGYGLGYTACMLYMMHFAEGKYKTAHFSICTAFMFLGLFLPGSIAGYLEVPLGYLGFFWLVMATCVPSVVVALAVQRKLPSARESSPEEKA